MKGDDIVPVTELPNYLLTTTYYITNTVKVE